MTSTEMQVSMWPTTFFHLKLAEAGRSWHEVG
jgi:hypothetical protein